jgi:hypothetical protein
MNVPRLYATATPLGNGKVLIAGGSPCYDVYGTPGLASAELYDTASGTFTVTGTMATPRIAALAITLAEGRVLVIGGDAPGKGGCSTPYHGPTQISRSSAEIYDSTSGKFTRVGSIIASVPDTATLLPDGRVLTADAESRIIETYDPASGTFSHSGSLRYMYEDLSSHLLPGGKVLFVGPTQLNGPRAEIYDPASRKSTPLTLQLPPSIAEPWPETATTLKDGRVLLCISGYLETFDPATGSFTASGSISKPDQWMVGTATLLPSGDVLFAGGELSAGPGLANPAVTNLAGLYDPVTGFRQISSMDTARDLATVTPLPDGRVLIAGGYTDLSHAISSAELFVP